jgi:rhodanese-related sulfurtransferase
MMKRKAVAAFAALLSVAFTGPVLAEGNRYDRDRYYHKEISVSEAYLAMEHSKGWDNNKNKGQPKPVMIDVRTLREYAGGHPEDAYNVPFPNIYVSGDQDPLVFYWEVYDIVKGNLDTPIMLLCRTGSRSVRAGNVLAEPESDPATAGLGLMPFTNVANVWEGYVGLYRYAFTGSPPLPNKDKPLDLNNDGDIGLLISEGPPPQYGDVADVYLEVADYNPDKDGWRNFAGLPWTTDVRKPLAYFQDPSLYDALNLTPVQ